MNASRTAARSRARSTPVATRMGSFPCRRGAPALAVLAALLAPGRPVPLAREPIPERLVVLTFDDAVKSHATVAAPVLERYGFGATFFITEGFSFASNKRDYMTWEEIRDLHARGFEIGNHTRDHLGVTPENV